MAITSYIRWDDNDVLFVLDQHVEVGNFIVLDHWSNSLRIDMFPHSGTLSWFRTNQSLFSLMLHSSQRSNKYQFHCLVWNDQDPWKMKIGYMGSKISYRLQWWNKQKMFLRTTMNQWDMNCWKMEIRSYRNIHGWNPWRPKFNINYNKENVEKNCLYILYMYRLAHGGHVFGGLKTKMELVQRTSQRSFLQCNLAR